MVGREYPGEGGVKHQGSRVHSRKNVNHLDVYQKLIYVLREPIEDPALLEVDGTQVEVVDGVSLNTWWVSGDWVALQKIKSRGSTQI